MLITRIEGNTFGKIQRGTQEVRENSRRAHSSMNRSFEFNVTQKVYKGKSQLDVSCDSRNRANKITANNRPRLLEQTDFLLTHLLQDSDELEIEPTSSLLFPAAQNAAHHCMLKYTSGQDMMRIIRSPLIIRMPKFSLTIARKTDSKGRKDDCQANTQKVARKVEVMKSLANSTENKLSLLYGRGGLEKYNRNTNLYSNFIHNHNT